MTREQGDYYVYLSLKLHFVSRFLQQSLTRLVEECEENLELRFPFETEVVESTSAAQGESNSPLNKDTNISLDASSTLGEESMDAYRGTLAAMKAIRGLQKASSTCNPFSFSSLLRRHDDDSTGIVTAGNSATNSLATLQNDKEDAQSEQNHLNLFLGA